MHENVSPYRQSERIMLYLYLFTHKIPIYLPTHIVRLFSLWLFYDSPGRYYNFHFPSAILCAFMYFTYFIGYKRYVWHYTKNVLYVTLCVVVDFIFIHTRKVIISIWIGNLWYFVYVYTYVQVHTYNIIHADDDNNIYLLFFSSLQGRTINSS